MIGKAMGALAAALMLAAAGGAAPQDLTVVGLDGKTRVFTPAELAAMPRGEASLPGKAGPVRYEGPLLTAILRAAGAPAGARLHGEVMRTYLLVTGSDGFGAVYSLAETDKDFHEGATILADSAGGAKLAEREGPYRLVAAGDKRGSRSVYKADRIEVRVAK